MQRVCGETIRPGGLLLTQRAIEQCRLQPGSRVLDVGCGTGASVEYLRNVFQMDAEGIDPSETMLARGLKRDKNLPVRQGCAENIPFPDRTMDGVLFECSLSQVTDIDKALKEAGRVIKEGGWLMISDIYIRKQEHSLPKKTMYSFTKGFLDIDSIMDSISKTGFEEAVWEDHTNKLIQMMLDIIMAYGSLKKFWEKTAGKNNCMFRDAAERRRKLGYFLLIARKTLIT
jgi:ubiquinone/menaquinone biosynthesis C-methylase UbiE